MTYIFYEPLFKATVEIIFFSFQFPHEAGSRVHRLGKGVNELLHCAKVLAFAVTEIYQSKTGKGEGVLL